MAEEEIENTEKATEAVDDSTPVTARPRKPWWQSYMLLASLAVVGVVAYALIFSEKSIPKRMEYQRTIDSLELCLRQQQDSLEYYRELNRRLSTDPELMEQVVREQYNMKRPTEDVYVFK